jgi:hypothetical protein
VTSKLPDQLPAMSRFSALSGETVDGLEEQPEKNTIKRNGDNDRVRANRFISLLLDRAYQFWE